MEKLVPPSIPGLTTTPIPHISSMFLFRARSVLMTPCVGDYPASAASWSRESGFHFDTAFSAPCLGLRNPPGPVAACQTQSHHHDICTIIVIVSRWIRTWSTAARSSSIDVAASICLDLRSRSLIDLISVRYIQFRQICGSGLPKQFNIVGKVLI